MSSYFNQNTPFGNFNRIINIDELQASRIDADDVVVDGLAVEDIAGTGGGGGGIGISGDLDMVGNNITGVGKLTCQDLEVTGTISGTVDVINKTVFEVIDEKMTLALGHPTNQTDIGTNADGLLINRNLTVNPVSDIYHKGTTLNSQLTGLQTQIDTKAPQATTYTKTEVDGIELGLQTQIDTKAPQATTYTKTEVDGIELGLQTQIDTKAPQATTYTKIEVDGIELGLQTQIDTKAPQATTYTKTEVDGIELGLQTQIDTKAPQATTYTKIEVDGIELGLQTQIDTKAPQATTYTKLEVDGIETGLQTQIDTKAPQATTYTKTEVDGLISGVSTGNDFETITVGPVGQKATVGANVSSLTVNKGLLMNGYLDIDNRPNNNAQIYYRWFNGAVNRDGWFTCQDVDGIATIDINNMRLRSLEPLIAQNVIVGTTGTGNKLITFKNTANGDAELEYCESCDKITLNKDFVAGDFILPGAFPRSLKQDLYEQGLVDGPRVLDWGTGGDTFWSGGQLPTDLSSKIVVSPCGCEFGLTAFQYSYRSTNPPDNREEVVLRRDPNDPTSALTATDGKRIFQEIGVTNLEPNSFVFVYIFMEDHIWNPDTSGKMWSLRWDPLISGFNSGSGTNQFGTNKQTFTVFGLAGQPGPLGAFPPNQNERLGIELDFINDKVVYWNINQNARIMEYSQSGSQAWVDVKNGVKKCRFGFAIYDPVPSSSQKLNIYNQQDSLFYSYFFQDPNVYEPYLIGTSYGGAGGQVDGNTLNIYTKQETDALLQPKITATSFDTLQNKTIDLTNNTIYNIGNSSLIGGIDVAKLANGSVTNYAFEQLHSAVFSDIVSTPGGFTVSTNQGILMGQHGTFAVPKPSNELKMWAGHLASHEANLKYDWENNVDGELAGRFQMDKNLHFNQAVKTFVSSNGQLEVKSNAGDAVFRANTTATVIGNSVNVTSDLGNITIDSLSANVMAKNAFISTIYTTPTEVITYQHQKYLQSWETWTASPSAIQTFGRNSGRDTYDMWIADYKIYAVVGTAFVELQTGVRDVTKIGTSPAGKECKAFLQRVDPGPIIRDLTIAPYTQNANEIWFETGGDAFWSGLQIHCKITWERKI